MRLSKARLLFCTLALLPLATMAHPSSTAPKKHERFDFRVRQDFFSGMSGDAAAFQRAMKSCAKRLATHPKDAQALVWQGTGHLWMAGQAFQKGNSKKGMSLWRLGLSEMDRAKKLDPNDIGVLIPIGASLIGAGMHMPPKMARGILAEGADAYQKTLAIQGSSFEKEGLHERCELLSGLAEAQARLSRTDEARRTYRRITAECRDSTYPEYVNEARAWLARKDGRVIRPHECVGCHE